MNEILLNNVNLTSFTYEIFYWRLHTTIRLNKSLDHRVWFKVELPVVRQIQNLINTSYITQSETKNE